MSLRLACVSLAKADGTDRRGGCRRRSAEAEEREERPNEGAQANAGDEFELCAVGLHEVRKEWDELAKHPLPDGRLVK